MRQRFVFCSLAREILPEMNESEDLHREEIVKEIWELTRRRVFASLTELFPQ